MNDYKQAEKCYKEENKMSSTMIYQSTIALLGLVVVSLLTCLAGVA